MFFNRLATRKISIAIAYLGLHSFYLNLSILPVELLEKKTFSGENAKISKVKNLILALEQIFLLELNPEDNVLKVAGSPAGLKRTL